MGLIEPTEPENAVDLERIRSRLDFVGVPTELSHLAYDALKGRAIGVLLYGSWARRDAGPHSDLDLILVSNIRMDFSHESKLSLNVYTPSQLKAAKSTIFGMHLARDGIILHDTRSQTQKILELFRTPNAVELLEKIRSLSIIMELPQNEASPYLSGLCQVGRYLLRTAIYALALREGQPCFSITELATRFKQPELVSILSSHAELHPHPTVETFLDLKDRLHLAVGAPSQQSFQSLHALIVYSSKNDPDLEKIGTLALGMDETLPYAELPKVLL